MGCAHYDSPLDIVAIKFKCCMRYFACFFCHEEGATHAAKQWSLGEFQVRAILCQRCNEELTIHQYLLCGSRCPSCRASFNPGCKEHWGLYFDV